MCEASAAVRYLDVTLCPVSAFADLCIAEFSNTARLRVEHLEKAYVLRAPSALGHTILSATSFTKQIGVVLREAGVSCDLSDKGSAGKPTVTHQLKKFAIAQAALVGLAGYGPDWAQAFDLGRAAEIPAGMPELVVSGLIPLAEALKVAHPDHAILHTIEALIWMVEVW
ncbi:hypothetical protein WJX72_005346 [[Myrmecia] bisecta]|uniref:Uncharacterized protein n=1 Tax=[Myrmecia] bisecta TaxID=41462 RepID=A0AAW1PGX4_9CHLO